MRNNTPFEDVIKQGEWLCKIVPLAKKEHYRCAWDFITPLFNKEFSLSWTKTQVIRRYRHYVEKISHPEKAYKFSPLSRTYTKEELNSFYEWLMKQDSALTTEWEQKWFEITHKKLSYRSIVQRMFQNGYHWGKSGVAKTHTFGKRKHNVGDIIVRTNTSNKNLFKVKWIKIKNYEDLTAEERAIHNKYKKCLECDPCWQRHDRYVLEKNGIIVGKNHIVHLNGNTLDDNIENLYVTDNYHEYNALKVKGLCSHPKLIEASLETRKTIRKVQELEKCNYI